MFISFSICDASLVWRRFYTVWVEFPRPDRQTVYILIEIDQVLVIESIITIIFFGYFACCFHSKEKGLSDSYDACCSSITIYKRRYEQKVSH